MRIFCHVTKCERTFLALFTLSGRKPPVTMSLYFILSSATVNLRVRGLVKQEYHVTHFGPIFSFYCTM